jgi:hypothetical protein
MYLFPTLSHSSNAEMGDETEDWNKWRYQNKSYARGFKDWNSKTWATENTFKDVINLIMLIFLDAVQC